VRVFVRHVRYMKRRPVMDSRRKLLDALEECGEAAAFYVGADFLMANGRCAAIFGRPVDEFEGLPILEICHNDSLDMIRDFIRRRAHDDPDVPTSYEAAFRTADRPKVTLRVNVFKMRSVEGALVIFREKV
jgi:PAS domain-containing protein